MSYGPKQTLLEGFNKFVIKNPGGCWDWKGSCPINPGYGEFRYGMKRIRAHRASWIIHNGEIPNKLQVLHKCDNRRCSNPEHLFLGTIQDNLIDAENKGRMKRGFFIPRDLNPRSILSKTSIMLAIELHKLGISNKALANMFNVHKKYLNNFIYNKKLNMEELP